LSVELYTAVCAPADELTVKAILALWLIAPEVPVTFTVAVPETAVAEAVSVNVEVALPFAAGVTGLVEKAAVTPLGRPVAVSVVAELKPFRLLMVIVLVPLPPGFIVNEPGAAPMLKFGVAAAVTVRVRWVVATKLADVPVMVTVAVPVVAVLLAVNEIVLVPVAGFGVNVADTPVGRLDAARVMLPVNPPWSTTVTVLDPAEPPWVIVRVLGESDKLKLGVEKPARALMRFCPFGLPHPVTRS
jgi:hypothetical protein